MNDVAATKIGSPEWWLTALATKLGERNTRIALLRRYFDVNAPLPEGAEGMRAAYQSFQRKARTNFAELVVEAVQERMMPAGFRIGEDRELDKTANAIWAANELDVFSGDVHTDMLSVGDGYVIVGWPQGGMPIITREDPALVITAHDPLRPHRVIAGLKLFRDDVAAKDIAYLYLPGVVYIASREATQQGGTSGLDISGMEWESTQFLPASDVVPVVRFRYHRGLGEYETHLDVLDRINYMVLQRMAIASLQAFRQRATKGDLPDTEPGTDKEGNPTEVPIDYNAIFRPGPGALWRLPDGVDLWESQTTDLTPLLAAGKDDIRDLAAVTRTPMAMLMPDSANQSAEGAAFAREGLVFKSQDRIKRATYGWNTVMGLALRFAGAGAQPVTTLWLPPERLSLSERADAASKATDIPWATKMTDIWQFSPEQVQRMEAERLNDALVSGIATMPGTVPTSGV
jgi:hypothetical protein